jgi:hypothetical protein
MHIRSLFVLGGALLLIAANACAGLKEDVATAAAKWGETLGQDDPDKVLALDATDAVLWGTLSPTVRSDRAALRDYFVNAFEVLPGLKAPFGEQLIRVYGDTAINTGYYTFPYAKDGEPKTLLARYSIVFVKDGPKLLVSHGVQPDKWLVDVYGISAADSGPMKQQPTAGNGGRKCWYVLDVLLCE